MIKMFTFEITCEDGSTYEIEAHNFNITENGTCVIFERWFDEANEATRYQSSYNYEVTKDFKRVRQITT